MPLVRSLCLLSLVVVNCVDAAALVWKLPEDGTSATFRGTYSLLVRRTDTTQQNEDLSWTRILTVRSVGSDSGEYRGETKDCRWLEFEQLTGNIVGGQVETGPGGRVTVKVLVPEDLVHEGIADNRGIPVSSLPIVRGWKQIDDSEPVEITSDGIDLAPSVSLLSFPHQLEASGVGGTEDVAGQSLSTSKWSGRDVIESTTQRTTSATDLWRSQDAPFGVAKWTVQIEVESKGSVAGREEFVPASTMREEMTLVEVSNGAVSRMNVP